MGQINRDGHAYIWSTKAICLLSLLRIIGIEVGNLIVDWISLFSKSLLFWSVSIFAQFTIHQFYSERMSWCKRLQIHCIAMRGMHQTYIHDQHIQCCWVNVVRAPLLQLKYRQRKSRLVCTKYDIRCLFVGITLMNLLYCVCLGLFMHPNHYYYHQTTKTWWYS